MSVCLDVQIGRLSILYTQRLKVIVVGEWPLRGWLPPGRALENRVSSSVPWLSSCEELQNSGFESHVQVILGTWVRSWITFSPWPLGVQPLFMKKFLVVHEVQGGRAFSFLSSLSLTSLGLLTSLSSFRLYDIYPFVATYLKYQFIWHFRPFRLFLQTICWFSGMGRPSVYSVTSHRIHFRDTRETRVGDHRRRWRAFETTLTSATVDFGHNRKHRLGWPRYLCSCHFCRAATKSKIIHLFAVYLKRLWILDALSVNSFPVREINARFVCINTS